MTTIGAFAYENDDVHYTNYTVKYPVDSKLYGITLADRSYWINHFGKTRPTGKQKKDSKRIFGN